MVEEGKGSFWFSTKLWTGVSGESSRIQINSIIICFIVQWGMSKIGRAVVIRNLTVKDQTHVSVVVSATPGSYPKKSSVHFPPNMLPDPLNSSSNLLLTIPGSVASCDSRMVCVSLVRGWRVSLSRCRAFWKGRASSQKLWFMLVLMTQVKRDEVLQSEFSGLGRKLESRSSRMVISGLLPVPQSSEFRNGKAVQLNA